MHGERSMYPFAAFTYRTDGTARLPQAVSSLGGHL